MLASGLAALLFILLVLAYTVRPNQSSEGLRGRLETLGQDRLVRGTLIGLGSYFTVLAYLQLTWYGKDGLVAFHWFDDSTEWMYIDKVGHFISTFHTSRTITMTFQAHSKNRWTSLITGTIAGWLLISMYEWNDGYAASYGASAYDLLANGGGALFSFVQCLNPDKKSFITPQFSFHPTAWAELRPNVLGQTFGEQLLKDYNGQTVWLAVNPHYYFGLKWWPRFLAFSVGYGAEGMVYGQLVHNQQHGYQAWEQFYVSINLDWGPLRQHPKRWVRGVVYAVDYFRLPGPAVEVNLLASQMQWIWHWLYS